jgi:uncharacterized transporter YbjL
MIGYGTECAWFWSTLSDIKTVHLMGIFTGGVTAGAGIALLIFKTRRSIDNNSALTNSLTPNP